MQSKLLCISISIPCKSPDLFTLVHCQLYEDVGSSTKTVNTNINCVTMDHAVGTVTNKSCTQQRCAVCVGIKTGKPETILFIGQSIFSIAPVNSVSGKACIDTEIFLSV